MMKQPLFSRISNLPNSCIVPNNRSRDFAMKYDLSPMNSPIIRKKKGED